MSGKTYGKGPRPVTIEVLRDILGRAIQSESLREMVNFLKSHGEEPKIWHYDFRGGFRHLRGKAIAILISAIIPDEYHLKIENLEKEISMRCQGHNPAIIIARGGQLARKLKALTEELYQIKKFIARRYGACLDEFLPNIPYQNGDTNDEDEEDEEEKEEEKVEISRSLPYDRIFPHFEQEDIFTCRYD